MDDPQIDPRLAKFGGTRKAAGDQYRFPGMMDRRHWQQSKVHQHTHWYGCAWCGVRFREPVAVYTHMAKVHGR